jgi:hypothetical protein
MSYDKLRTSKRLKCCSVELKQQQTLKQARKFATSNDLDFDDSEYRGSQSKQTWRCTKHGGERNTCWHTLRHTNFKFECCVQHSKQLVLSPILQTHDYVLVGEFKDWHSKITIYCNKHNQYRNTRARILRDGGMLRCCEGEARSGNKHPNFNTNITETQRVEDRRSHKNKTWSKQVRTRDCWSCVLCSHNHQCVAHHLNSYMANPKQRYEVSNGVTLCRSCHKEFHKTYGKNTTKEQFETFKTTFNS